MKESKFIRLDMNLNIPAIYVEYEDHIEIITTKSKAKVFSESGIKEGKIIGL